MALKFSVDALDSVDEAYRPLYSEQNGKFVLSVEGAVAKERHDEFRDTNINLRKQVETLTEKFKDVDLDKYRELAATETKIREKQLIDAGKVDELISERVAAMKADQDRQIKAIAGERDEKQRQLENLLVDGALRDAALKSSILPHAVDDVLLRGKMVFKVVDGKAVAMDGDKPLYGKDSEPLGVSEWLSGMTEKAPHWFPPSTGGGAPKGGSQSNSGGQKTMTRLQFDALDPLAKRAAIKDTKIVD